jgi:hypothetical protein
MTLRAITMIATMALLAPHASAQEPVWSASGEALFDSFGGALDLVGDVDGDAIDDVLVGAPYSNINLYSAGSAWLLSGATGAALQTWRGSGLNDQLGLALASVDDADGDGLADVVIGVPNYAGSSVAGSAELRSSATGALLRTYLGVLAGGAFGASVTALDDLDGDGVRELLIGAPGAAAFYVYDGATGTQRFQQVSIQSGSNLGWSSARCDDVDGDGVADLLVSSPFWRDLNGTVVGRLQVRSGVDGSTLRCHYGENTSSFQNDFYGYTVVSLTDRDSDGVRDYATCAWGWGSCQQGRVYVYSGASGSELARFDGMACGDFAGFALADLGDVDHDGVGDLGIGYPNRGPSGEGLFSLRSGADGHELSRIEGGAHERLGIVAAPGGDLDHDGDADLVIAAIGSASSFTGSVARVECEAPSFAAMTPERGSYKTTTAVALTGHALRAEAGLVVEVDGVAVADLVAVDSAHCTFTVLAGPAGLPTLTLRTAFGSVDAPYKRTPATTVAGDFVPGGSGLWSTFLEPGDAALLIAGLPPRVALSTPPFDGVLEIAPYTVVWFEPPVTGDRFDLAFTIEDDPALVGLRVLAQSLAGPKLGGKHKDGCWTNAVEIEIR